MAVTDIHGGHVWRELEENVGVMEFQSQSFAKQ